MRTALFLANHHVLKLMGHKESLDILQCACDSGIVYVLKILKHKICDYKKDGRVCQN